MFFNNNIWLITAGSFGRRASDGGANLHVFYQQHGSNSGGAEDGGWSQPGSREHLQPVRKIYSTCILHKLLNIYKIVN